MGKWVVTVAGIAILSVLCDVILPEGQTRKYIRTVFGVVVSLVIISPLVKLFANGFDADVVESGAVSSQQGYLDSVAEREKQYALKSIESLLKAKDITVKKIELNSTADTLVIEIATPYSAERNVVVEQIVNSYFPDVELVTIWGSV